MPSSYKVRHLTPLPSAGLTVNDVKSGKVEVETLPHAATCEKRNDHLHNSSIEMLSGGYHRSFTEIFNLVQNRKRERIEAGPGSEMSLEIVLENNSAYIDKLKYHLSEAEKGERLKQYSDVYENISKLAVYFDNENVQWLAHHFYTRALDVAKKVKLDSSKSLCEASEKCGLASESINDLESSKLHLEKARKLSKGRNLWKHKSGETWHQQISSHLSRVLFTIAKDLETSEAVKILEASVLAADESKNENIISKSYFHFGTSQFKLKQYKEAEESLHTALKNAIKINNEELIQKLTSTLSKLTREGPNTEDQLSKASEYLQLAVNQINTEVGSSVEALSQMALLYNAYGKYENAKESINQAYVKCKDADGRELSTRVSSGTINGNIHFQLFRKVLAKSTNDNEQLRRIINWKNESENNLLEN